MFVFFGTRRLGKVEEVDGTSIQTTFACVNFVPVYPMGSVAVTVDDEGNETDVRPLRLVVSSVVAGYVRAYLFVAAIGFAVMMAMFTMNGGDLRKIGFAALLAMASLRAGLWAMRDLGVATDEEAARRRVYAKYVGLPIDVAHLPPEEAESLRTRLDGELARDAPRMIAATYRSGALAWDAALAREAIADESFLTAAATLGRLEEVRGEAAKGEAGRLAMRRLAALRAPDDE